MKSEIQMDEKRMLMERKQNYSMYVKETHKPKQKRSTVDASSMDEFIRAKSIKSQRVGNASVEDLQQNTSNQRSLPPLNDVSGSYNNIWANGVL